MRKHVVALGHILGVTVLPVLLFGQSTPPAKATLALKGATLYMSPKEPAIKDGVILIAGNKISEVGSTASTTIPQGVEVLDCTGLTITAGYWNSHVHFVERKWANAASIPAAELADQLQDMVTRFGFTSVFDTGSSWQNTRRLRGRIESGEVAGPRIYSTGEILFPKGGAPEPRILDVVGTMRIAFPEVSDEADAAAAASKLLDAGADGIKIYACSLSWPSVHMPEAAIRGAVRQAHGRGKLVFAHPQTRQGLLASVRAGIDVLVHTAPNAGAWDEEILTLMKKGKVVVIPTLKLWRHELRHERRSNRQRFVQAGVEQLRTWVKAEGKVLFGTDVGYMDDYNPAEEYELMEAAGMDARQILASLTTIPAEQFWEAGRSGRIAKGQAADLVVLEKDPSVDVRYFASVRLTIRDGKVIYKANTAPLIRN
jgi:imidazolonepropionase-like amidohydrolase